jgi:hypothetical protein
VSEIQGLSMRVIFWAMSKLQVEHHVKHGDARNNLGIAEEFNPIVQNIRQYKSFAGVPRDLVQQVLDELVRKQLLSPATLELFSDCSLQVWRFLIHGCNLENLAMLFLA